MKRTVVFIILTIMLLPFLCTAETINGLETNAGYYSLKENDGNAENVDILRFRENGQIRFMLAYLSKRTYYDFFSNKMILQLKETGELRYSTRDIEAVSEEFFDADTQIADIQVIDIHEYDWFWNFHPDLTPGKYEDMRVFYESIFQAGERFPRKQIAPADHPQSRIPRDRDTEYLSDIKNHIYFLEANYEGCLTGEVDPVWFLAEKSETVVEDKNGSKSFEVSYSELFTGTWLFTHRYKGDSSSGKKISSNYNLEYFTSLRGGRKLFETRDSTKKIPDYYISIEHDLTKKSYVSYSGNVSLFPYHIYLTKFFAKAKTVGDLRRVYEMMPKENWFIPAFSEEPFIPVYTPTDAKTHPAANAQQLFDAIANAQNGDTIVILCDIRIQQPGFLVKNKKLKITGLPGKLPKVYVDRDSSYIGSENYYYVFQLDNGTVEFGNLIIDAGYKTGGVFAKGKSSINLGQNVEITKCEYAITVSKNTDLVIDGAYIHHNTGSVISVNSQGSEYGTGQVHFISGEIAYNIANWCAIRITGKTGSFVMDGGSIHDNAKSDTQQGLISVSAGAKAEINGGSIYHNVAAAGSTDSPVISCDGGTLAMSGGEVFDNLFTGGLGCGIAIGFGSSNVQSKNSVFTMTGGKIYDNHPGVSYFCHYRYGTDYMSNANILIFAISKLTSTFEMKGGEVYQTNYYTDMGYNPDIVIEGAKSRFVLSGGTIDIKHVTVRKGQLINKK